MPLAPRGLPGPPLPSMEGDRPPSHGDQLELSVLEGQVDEQTPLRRAVQVTPSSAEEPRPAQVRSPWRWRRCPGAGALGSGLPARTRAWHRGVGFPALCPRATDAGCGWCALGSPQWSGHRNVLQPEPPRPPWNVEESFVGGVWLLSSERESQEKEVVLI